MKHYKRYFLPTLLLLNTLNAGAFEPEIKTQYVYANGGENLRELLVNQVGIPSNVLDEQGYFEKIKSWNPAIEDASNLAQGERVYVEIPYRTILAPPIDMNRTMASTSQDSIKKTQKKQDESSGLSVFYTLSSGTFEETMGNQALTTTSSQDSPITLGVNLNRSINESWNYSGSVYFSKLDDGVSDANESVTIPLEYGINSYIGYNFNKITTEIYTGFDHERFSSFNTDELSIGEALDVRTHVLTFATFGVAKRFEAFQKSFLVKLSYSTSLASDQNRESIVNPDPFTGSKYIMYLSMQGSSNWSYHAFYKQHDLKGATELQIVRLGLGFGYSF